MYETIPCNDNHVYECTVHPCNQCINPNVTCMTTGANYHKIANQKPWCNDNQHWQHIDYMICDACGEEYKESNYWDDDPCILTALEMININGETSSTLHLCPNCLVEMYERGETNGSKF